MNNDKLRNSSDFNIDKFELDSKIGRCWVSHCAIELIKCRLGWVNRNPTKLRVSSTQPTKCKAVQVRFNPINLHTQTTDWFAEIHLNRHINVIYLHEIYWTLMSIHILANAKLKLKMIVFHHLTLVISHYSFPGGCRVRILWSKAVVDKLSRMAAANLWVAWDECFGSFHRQCRGPSRGSVHLLFWCRLFL